MRQPKPWFRSSKDAWYVEFNGKQRMLAKGRDHEKAAWDAFYKLMATDPAKLPKAADIIVAVVCDLFLDHAAKHNDARTFAWYKSFLQDFCGRYGSVRAADVKPFHVDAWLDEHPQWKAARRHAVIAVKRAFNWADKKGVLSPNPVRAVEKPAATKRTHVLTKAERQEILDAVRDQEFRDFLFAMQETGCRPSEVARVTAANVNLDVGVWVFHEHKTAKRTGRPRVIYLTPAMVDLSRRLMAKHPTGPLFCGPRGGRPFNANNVCCRFRRLREKLPHLRHAVAYAYRHGYATEALVNGVGVAQVAELLGHTSTDMVLKHYGHLADQLTHMKEAAQKAVA